MSSSLVGGLVSPFSFPPNWPTYQHRPAHDSQAVGLNSGVAHANVVGALDPKEGQLAS